jgi:hypothetical protein
MVAARVLAKRRAAGIAAYAAVVAGAVLLGAACSAAAAAAAAARARPDAAKEEPFAVAGDGGGDAGAPKRAKDAGDGDGEGEGEGDRRSGDDDVDPADEQRAVNAPMSRGTMRCGARRGGAKGQTEFDALLRSATANAASPADFGSDSLLPPGFEADDGGCDDDIDVGSTMLADLQARRNMDGLFLACRLRSQGKQPAPSDDA